MWGYGNTSKAPALEYLATIEWCPDAEVTGSLSPRLTRVNYIVYSTSTETVKLTMKQKQYYIILIIMETRKRPTYQKHFNSPNDISFNYYNNKQKIITQTHLHISQNTDTAIHRPEGAHTQVFFTPQALSFHDCSNPLTKYMPFFKLTNPPCKIPPHPPTKPPYTLNTCPSTKLVALNRQTELKLKTWGSLYHLSVIIHNSGRPGAKYRFRCSRLHRYYHHHHYRYYSAQNISEQPVSSKLLLLLWLLFSNSIQYGLLSWDEPAGLATADSLLLNFRSFPAICFPLSHTHTHTK